MPTLPFLHTPINILAMHRTMDESVNVLVSDVPGSVGTVCLQVGHVRNGVRTDAVSALLSARTGLPNGAFRLRSGGRVVCDALVASPGQRDAYIALQLCRALPGGKGGFGANLRGAAAARRKTSNFAACRDLAGRRLRDVEREEARAALQEEAPVAPKRPRTPSPVRSDGEEADVADVDDIADAMRAHEDDLGEDIRVGRRAARAARKRRRLAKETPRDKVPATTGGDVVLVDVDADDDVVLADVVVCD